MALKEEIINQGNWLFRRRSYLPLMLLPLIILASYTDHSILQFPAIVKIFDVLSFIICAVGFLIRVVTIGQVPKGTSGRNTKKQIASTLNTSGIYSVVRHPLYLGNFFMWLGIILYVKSIWLSLLFPLIYWVYYERIMFAEEAFLINKFGKEYLLWSALTPPFFPNLALWRKSELDFSFRNVLKREYSGFMAAVIGFVFLDNWLGFVHNAVIRANLASLKILGLSMFIFFTLRILRKKTKLLKVSGR